MSNTIGGHFTWYTGSLDHNNNKKVLLNDFNATISFNRGQNGNDNSVKVYNNETSTKLENYSHQAREHVVKVQEREQGIFLDILGLDKDTTTFSQTDFDRLLAKNNKITKIDNKYSYKVENADPTKGVADIFICTINADGSSKKIGTKITIDIETDAERKAYELKNKKDEKNETNNTSVKEESKEEPFIEALKNKYNDWQKARAEKKEANFQKSLRENAPKLEQNSKGAYKISSYKDGYMVDVNKEVTLYELALYLDADPLEIARKNPYSFPGQEIGAYIASAENPWASTQSIEMWKEVVVPAGAYLEVPVVRR